MHWCFSDQRTCWVAGTGPHWKGAGSQTVEGFEEQLELSDVRVEVLGSHLRAGNWKVTCLRETDSLAGWRMNPKDR